MTEDLSPKDLARGAAVVEGLRRAGYDFTGYEHLLIPDDGSRAPARHVFDGLEGVLYLGDHVAAECIPAGRVTSVSINPIQDYLELTTLNGMYGARIPTTRRTVLVFDCIVDHSHSSGAMFVHSRRGKLRVQFKSSGVIFQATASVHSHELVFEFGSARLHVEFECDGEPISSAA